MSNKLEKKEERHTQMLQWKSVGMQSIRINSLIIWKAHLYENFTISKQQYPVMGGPLQIEMNCKFFRHSFCSDMAKWKCEQKFFRPQQHHMSFHLDSINI